MTHPSSRGKTEAVGRPPGLAAWHQAPVVKGAVPFPDFETPPVGLAGSPEKISAGRDAFCEALTTELASTIAHRLEEEPGSRWRRETVTARQVAGLMLEIARRYRAEQDQPAQASETGEAGELPEAAWTGPTPEAWLAGVRGGAASERIKAALTSLGDLRRVGEVAITERLGRPLERAESLGFHGTLDAYATAVATIFAQDQDERLQADTRALTKYLAFLSHDLRGNLNGALLMIEVLRRDLRKDPQFAENLEDLEQMRQSMMELVQTMDRFLIAERLRQGRVEVSLQRVDLCKFLREQRDGMSRQRRGSGETIEVIVPEKIELVTDREMLSLIVQNLLSNCVKYSNGGMVGMRAFAQNEAEAGGYRLEISDTGPGMSPEIKKDLFTPFARAADRTRGGTGLGLFIAKQAADLIGAKITVDSELGCGTMFLVDLPPRPPA